ncbi:unnamed protein product [Blepharisma stoltei]|uniref:Kinase n=1 Tax=Blepharisma stoltei TaxID=1481888 RepID=A0AAU9IH42_9CILI|nr:unnamed protein product [Blepharisma stoltei]
MEPRPQAGGHEGILIFRRDKVLKRALPCELNFYTNLFNPNNQIPILLEFQKFVPKFYGSQLIDGSNYIVLENLLWEYENPSIMDCKIGRVTWTRDHSPPRCVTQQLRASKTTTSSLGFRITGLLIKDREGHVTDSIRKKQVFDITPDNILDYFARLVIRDDVFQEEVVDQFIMETQEILDWFRKQRVSTFFTCSVLYVNGFNKAQTKFIDFSYVYESDGQRDTNMIEGLESLINTWEKLKMKYAKSYYL